MIDIPPVGPTHRRRWFRRLMWAGVGLGGLGAMIVIAALIFVLGDDGHVLGVVS